MSKSFSFVSTNYIYQYLIMKKFGLLFPKYIFVQYQFVLLTKFGPLIPKYIFVLCVYFAFNCSIDISVNISSAPN
jgi:hypothetical protein